MLVPDTILQGRYQVVRPIGEGGMGTVYMAEDLRLGSTVALKETFFTDDRMRGAFEREARLLASLRHPALPKVIDHFIEEEGQFLVMEFIPGDDLLAMLAERRAPFPPGEVLVWGDQLLDALDYLHTQPSQIIHRDIKPQNLKLLGRGQIILLDFGLAKGNAPKMARVTAGNSLMAFTPHYSPLEQMQGVGTDPRSDLYSLAATLYHLITGIKPVDAMRRAAASTREEPDPLKLASELNGEVSLPVARVLAHALALDREDRPDTAAELRAELREARRHSAPIRITGEKTVPVVKGPENTSGAYPPSKLPFPPATTLDDTPASAATSGASVHAQTRELVSPAFPTQGEQVSTQKVTPDTQRGRRRGRGLLWAVIIGALLSIAALGLIGPLRGLIKPSDNAAPDQNANVSVETGPAQPDETQPPPEQAQSTEPAEPETTVDSLPEETQPPPDANGEAVDPTLAARTTLSNFRAVSISDTEMRVSVDYTYEGNQQDGKILVAAYPLQGNGSRIATGFRPYPVKAGSGSASVNVVLRGKGSYASTRVRVCMYTSGGQTFRCETYPFNKTWTQGPGPIATSNSIRNFRATSVSDSELRVTVDYSYIGDKGRERILMSAQAIQSNGGTVPSGYYPAPVKVGEGSATVSVFLRRETIVTTSIKVCMFVGGSRIFFCETFPFTKSWNPSYVPPPRNENRNSGPTPGECASVDNRTITANVYSSLRRSRLSGEALGAISVYTSNGIVTLAGTLQSDRARQEAVRAASQVPCVRRVDDRLEVKKKKKKDQDDQ